jgi:hypothetical protein
LENEAFEFSSNLWDKKGLLKEKKSSLIKMEKNWWKNNKKFLMQKHNLKV